LGLNKLGMGIGPLLFNSLAGATNGRPFDFPLAPFLLASIFFACSFYLAIDVPSAEKEIEGDDSSVKSTSSSQPSSSQSSSSQPSSSSSPPSLASSPQPPLHPAEEQA